MSVLGKNECLGRKAGRRGCSVRKVCSDRLEGSNSRPPLCLSDLPQVTSQDPGFSEAPLLTY